MNRLSRAHERYRQTDDRRQTDGRAIAYSEREREFAFAKKDVKMHDTTLNVQVAVHITTKHEIARHEP